jgi:hypothetical protein
MKKNLLVATALLFALVLSTGCQNEIQINGNVAESKELEEFILAGLDFQESMVEFNKELNEIDIRTIRPVLDSKGRMVLELPTSISIEDKAKRLNTSKKVLLDKFPELTRVDSRVRRDYINKRVNSSERIMRARIESDNIFELPRLRSGHVESYTNEADVFAFIDSFMLSPDYVEVVFIAYEDGTVDTYITENNTAYESYTPTIYTKNDGKYYTSFHLGSPILYIAHSHISGSTAPAPTDLENRYGVIDEYIYTSGGVLTKYPD